MKRSGFSVLARLVGLVRPLMGYMVLAVVMGLIGHLCAAAITVLGGYAILEVLSPSNVSLIVLFVAAALCALVRGFLRYAEQACNHFIAFKLLALIRDRVFGALRRLCPAKLEGRDKGDLISVITSDIELLEVFYAHTLSPICIAVLFCTILVCFIGRIHWALGLLALLAYVSVGVVIPLITSKISGDAGDRFRRRSGELASFVLDSLRGLPETLQFGQGAQRMAQMNARTEGLSREEERMKRITGRNSAVTGSAILIFDLAMLFLSARLCGFQGCLLATLALMSSFGPVVALAALGATLQNTFAAGNRVLDILEETPVTQEITGKKDVDFQGAQVKNVTFSYGEEAILQDFSLSIPKNTIIGITGRSGSGKSTLLRLLMRFWRVEQGSVEISGRSVEEINTANLRDMESFVTQQTHLFHDSIRDNLRIARLDATDAQIIAACKKASVHDFIMSLPRGYDTPVGELGETLSGGERQRLGLARAFLHDAPLLLLDEPTSNLDSLNEAVILRSLDRARAGKTVILVSHRKSTMGIADAAYSVERGRMS